MEKEIPHNVQSVPNKCHVCGGWRLRPLDQIGISQCSCPKKKTTPPARILLSNQKLVTQLTKSNELLNILLLRQRESSEAYKMITAQIKANKEIIKEASS